jgi:tetratricopeptide (TPR) repeat protein
VKKQFVGRVLVAGFLGAAMAASLLARSPDAIALARPHGSPAPSPSPSESPTPTQAERIATLQQTVRDNPNDKESHEELGVLLIQTGQPAQGRDELETARRLGQSDAQLWFYVGIADNELGDPSDGALALEQAREFDPANDAVLENLADTYLQLNRVDDARRIATSSITLHPDEAFGYIALGTVDLDQMQFADGRAQLQKALTIDPTNERAKMLIARSYIGQPSPDPDAALAIINPLVAADPKDVEALGAQADAYSAKNDIPDALAALQAIVKLNPTDVRAEDDIGEFYLNKKMVTQARAEFAQAIKDHPKEAEPYALQADYDARDKNYTLAASEYESALALDPSNTQLLYAAGRFYLLNDNKPAIAQQKFQALVAAAPGDSEALFWLGEAYAAENKWADARDRFQQSFNVDHTYTALFNLGLSYFNLKDYPHARDAFEALIPHQDKNHPDLQLWYVLGDTLRLMGDKKGAIVAYQQFIKLAPKSVAAVAKAKAYVKQLGG